MRFVEKIEALHDKLWRIFGSERTILFNIHSFTPWHAMGIALAAKLNILIGNQ
jgi:hypothetical protein